MDVTLAFHAAGLLTLGLHAGPSGGFSLGAEVRPEEVFSVGVELRGILPGAVEAVNVQDASAPRVRFDMSQWTGLLVPCFRYSYFVGCGVLKGGVFVDTAAAVAAPTGLARLTAPPSGELKLAIVLGKGAEVLDFSGPLEVFAAASTEDGHPLFKPYFVAQTKDPVTVGGDMRVIPDYTFADAPAPKVVVIPAMEGDTPEMLDWIRKVSAGTDVTMSVCNGAFVLARTGLLDGKPATAHHGGYFRFAGDFPKVKLQRGARFTESGNLASSGGISSGIDLALRVVARYLGDESAHEIADGMEYQGPGWHDERSNVAYSRMPEGDSKTPKCPVCGMEADPKLTSVFEGKTYAFCADSEKEYFDRHLDVAERFLAEDAKRPTTMSR